MNLLRSADARVTSTPNAVMTTFASMSIGASPIALWRTEMVPGAQGPEHSFDVDQVWTVLGGGARIHVDGATVAIESGDTVVLPAGALRQIQADPTRGLTAVVAAPSGGAATASGAEPVVPAWAC